MILNLGCGEEIYGDIRADIIPSSTSNIVCDAHFLPFRNEVFDEVCTKNLFEHLSNPLQSLTEQKRILKYHGKLSIVTDNASYWRFHLPSKSAHINYVARGKLDSHYALYLPFHLENFFRKLDIEQFEIKFYVQEKAHGITGLINYFLRKLSCFQHFGYGTFKIVGFKIKKRRSWQNAKVEQRH